ncbi:23.5 kDa heat shock protein [Hirschfeldia incana]|nr:23.5 kDa heat shock protein [Hirschfeldia incana]
MASSSSLVLRRLLSSSVIPRSVRPAASLRLFNTNAAARSYEQGDDTRNHRSNRTVSPRRGDFFSVVLNFMDQLDQTPIVSSSTRGAMGVRRGWDAKEKDDGLHLRIDMPGLSREDVKLALEENTLVIRGEGGDGEEDGRKFSRRIGLPEKVYKTDEIKAEMKNGVLRVVVPKMNEDERNNVRHIHVD